MKRLFFSFLFLGLLPSFGVGTIDSSFDELQKSVQALEPRMFSYAFALFATLASIELAYGLYKVLLANEKLHKSHEKTVSKRTLREKENQSVEDLVKNKQNAKKELLHLAKQISNLTIKKLARVSTVLKKLSLKPLSLTKKSITI